MNGSLSRWAGALLVLAPVVGLVAVFIALPSFADRTGADTIQKRSVARPA